MMLEASKNLTARTPRKEREQYSPISWLLVVVAKYRRAKHQLPQSIITGTVVRRATELGGLTPPAQRDLHPLDDTLSCTPASQPPQRLVDPGAGTAQQHLLCCQDIRLYQ